MEGSNEVLSFLSIKYAWRPNFIFLNLFTIFLVGTKSQFSGDPGLSKKAILYLQNEIVNTF